MSSSCRFFSNLIHNVRTAVAAGRSQRKRSSRQSSWASVPALLEHLESRQLLSATATEIIPGQHVSGPSESVQVTLTDHFDDPQVEGSVYEIGTALGTFHIETYDTITPKTASNFRQLVEGGNYDDMFFHRLVTGFVLQGGGFRYPSGDSSPSAIDSISSIENEFDNWFDPNLGGLAEGTPLNVRGTIAMAKVGGDPDSATSQWFVNDADNSGNLDSQNGGFTVFARVLYNGMDVVDDLMDLTAVNAEGPFTSLPVVDWEPGQNVLRDNLLITTTEAADELTYEVVVTEGAGQVDAQIVDGVLTVTSTASAQSGYATVVVAATDVGGTKVEQTFRVAIGLPADVTLNSQTGVPASHPEISWQPAGGADTYDLWVSKMSDLGPLTVQEAGILRANGLSETAYNQTGDLEAGVYRAWVRARNSTGVGSWGQPIDFAVGLSKPARPAIDSVTADETNAQRVTINWDTVNQATGYQVWIVDSSGTVVTNEIVSETSFYTDFDLTSGENYRAWVRGVNYSFESDWSPVRSFVADASSDPVTIVSPGSSSSIADTARPVVEWTSPTDHGEYDVWVTKVGTSGAYLRETTDGTSFQPQTDLPEGIYRVWVRPPAQTGIAWSSPVTIGVGTQATVTAPTGGGVSANPTIRWSAGIPGTTTQLWLNGPSGRVLFETGLTGTSFEVPETLPDGNYTAWVRQAPPIGAVFGWSAAHRFEVGTNSTPGTPSLLVSGSGSTFTFSWQAVSNAVRYELWVNSDSTSRIIHETQITDLTFQGTLTEAGSHRAWLRAYNAEGTAGAWSAVQIFTV